MLQPDRKYVLWSVVTCNHKKGENKKNFNFIVLLVADKKSVLECKLCNFDLILIF